MVSRWRRWLVVLSALSALGMAAATATLAGSARHVAKGAAWSTGGEPATATPHARYLPFVAKVSPTGSVVTVPVESRALRSSGPTHQDAFDPSGAGVYDLAREGVVEVSTKTDDYGHYDLVRTVMRAPIPEEGDIVGAAVVLKDVHAGWDTFHQPLPAPVLSIHPGMWTSDSWGDPPRLWSAYDASVVGRRDIEALYADADSAEALVVRLDPAWLRPGATLKLVARDSEDHIDLGEAYTDARTRWVAALSGAYLRLRVD